MATVKPHIRLRNIQKLAGFLVEDIGTEETKIKIIYRGFFHSDQKEFYKYANQISENFIGKSFVDAIHTYLIIIHHDSSADIYINDIPIKIRGLMKRDVQVGDPVEVKNIADIEALWFEGIEIKEDDNIVFCFKKGWKFGIFFDFTQYMSSSALGTDSALDVDALSNELGSYYKYLTFQEEYAVLENEEMFAQMFSDGWFPFIQLLGGDFHKLSSFYKDKERFASSIDAFIDGFDKDKISSFVSTWWRNQVFKEKQEIIDSGIRAYLANDFIACIKTLYSEIEGIVRIAYVRETNKKNLNFSELTKYVQMKTKSKFVSLKSLGFPDVFFKYLNEVIFRDFDLQTGKVDLSRHSTSHGVAKAEDYTKAKALQGILVLDQMSFFI